MTVGTRQMLWKVLSWPNPPFPVALCGYPEMHRSRATCKRHGGCCCTARAPRPHRGDHWWSNTREPSQNAPTQTAHKTLLANTPPVFLGFCFTPPLIEATPMYPPCRCTPTCGGSHG